MGNLANKCSCFQNDEKQINHIETAQSKVSSTIESPKHTTSTMQELLNIKNTKTSLFKISEIKKPKKLNILQATVRGWLFRIKFRKSLNLRLIENTSNVIRKYKNEFTSINLIKAENTFGSFDQEKWKKYYILQEMRNFLNQFGFLLKTKILIYKNISYYIGTVNLEGQRCGYGELVTIQGKKFQGSWVNNKFNGWGRYIDEEGTLWEGNNIIY
jgi:hypothetical protein